MIDSLSILCILQNSDITLALNGEYLPFLGTFNKYHLL